MSALNTSSDDSALRGQPLARDQTRALLGQVMGLVAFTLGFLALGAYVGRDLSGGLGIAFFVAGFACLIGLNIASGRDRQQLCTTLLFGFGLLLGLALGPVINAYAKADPAAAWQAAGATGAFVAGLGAIGYATRRDLSSRARGLFWALLGLIVFGLVGIFVSIPHANVIYAVAGLVIFGGYTIFDFNRLHRAGIQDAVPIAASIFLDIVNVFLLFLELFGRWAGLAAAFTIMAPEQPHATQKAVPPSPMPRDKRLLEAETLDGQDAYAAAGIPMRRTDVRDLTGAGSLT